MTRLPGDTTCPVAIMAYDICTTAHMSCMCNCPWSNSKLTSGTSIQYSTKPPVPPSETSKIMLRMGTFFFFFFSHHTTEIVLLIRIFSKSLFRRLSWKVLAEHCYGSQIRLSNSEIYLGKFSSTWLVSDPVSQCENFWAFTGPRVNLGLILLINIIQMSFPGPR